MKRAEGTRFGGASVNEICQDIPIYPVKGVTGLRVLPMFDLDGQECPWVDFSIGTKGSFDGLGDQHFEVSTVSAFFGGTVHTLSGSVQGNGGTTIPSPANKLSAKFDAIIELTGEQIKKGQQPADPRFSPGKFGAWIYTSSSFLTQSLLLYHDGQPVRTSPSAGYGRFVLLDWKASAMVDLTNKLFSCRIGVDAQASETNTLFADYVSCAQGDWIIIEPVPATQAGGNQKYSVRLGGGKPYPLDPAEMRKLVRRWDDGPNPVYRTPDIQTAMSNLRRIFPMDMIGYGLLGSMFEPFLTDDEKYMGNNLAALLSGRTQVHMSEPPQAQAPTSAFPSAPVLPASATGAPGGQSSPPLRPPQIPSPPQAGTGLPPMTFSGPTGPTGHLADPSDLAGMDALPHLPPMAGPSGPGAGAGGVLPAPPVIPPLS